MTMLCLLGGFQTSPEPHRDPVAGCDAPVLPNVLWRAPFLLGDFGLPPSRHRGLRHGQGEKGQKGEKVSCVVFM